MSETFKATREGIRGVRSAWLEASEEAQWNFIFWVVSALGIFASIIWAFGWAGFWFCLFFGINRAINHSIDGRKK